MANAPILEPVVLFSTNGWSLPGELRRPDVGGVGVRDASERVGLGAGVLLLHQLRRDRHSMDALSDALAQKGFVTLAVDSRGHGESRQDGRARSWELFDEGAGEFKGLADDAKTAFGRLRQSVPNGPLFVVGSSVGGNCAVLLAATLENHVAGLVLLSAGFNYRGVDCRDAVPSVRCPALLVASSEDSYAHHCSQKMAKAMPGGKFIGLVDAGHGTDMLRYDNLFARVVEWIGQRVR